MNFYDQFRIPRGERWIRLLQVHACYGYKKEGAPVQCDLFVVDLDTQPQFSALSYVWGVATDNPRTILCGGTELAVTPNCYSALSHLRQYLGTFTIWVDAICIDQNNEEDKVHQIPLMGDIYSGASTVYAWLGEGNPASARAMAYLANAGFSRFFFKGGSLVGGELQPSRVWGATVEHVISRLSLKRSYILTEGPCK
jgi:hypothetical protein